MPRKLSASSESKNLSRKSKNGHNRLLVTATSVAFGLWTKLALSAFTFWWKHCSSAGNLLFFFFSFGVTQHAPRLTFQIADCVYLFKKMRWYSPFQVRARQSHVLLITSAVTAIKVTVGNVRGESQSLWGWSVVTYGRSLSSFKIWVVFFF